MIILKVHVLMGSSKKSKDKDRDRNKEDRKKRKHRSRSRSRDKHHRHKHKKKSRRRDGEDAVVVHSQSRSPLSEVSDQSSEEAHGVLCQLENSSTVAAAPCISDRTPSPSYTPPPRGRKRGYGEEGRVTVEEQSSKRSKEGAGGGWQDDEASPPQGSGGDNGGVVSLSVEETNKIRAKLGLKPLQVQEQLSHQQETEDLTPLQAGEKKIVEDSHEFIHKPAQNIQDKVQVEKLREKIAAQREKRRQKEKLSRVKTLAESDSEDDTLAWVHKSRKLSKEREQALKKAQQLEELDAEFGVGDLVQEEVAKDMRRAYGRQQLFGLKVLHHASRFSEGSTILTLADADVLAAADDELINVNLVDEEAAELNIERRRQKDDLEYEAPEMDDFGNLKQSNVLKKYDEELVGRSKASFRLGNKGQAVLDDNAHLQGLGEKQQRLARLRQLHSLASADNQLASEYMTQDEASAAFRKPKKMRKKRKKTILTADDLEPLDDDEIHHGSRSGGAVQRLRVLEESKLKTVEALEPGEVEGGKTKTLRELMEEEEESTSHVEVGSLLDHDNEIIEDDLELQEALANSRKAKIAKQRQPKLEDIRMMLETNESVEDSVPLSDLLHSDSNPGEGANPGLVVTLNTTDEFCRTLGDIPTYGLSGNRAADEDQSTALLQQSAKAAAEPVGVAGAWEEVGIDDTKVEIAESQSVPILDEEPDASKGVGNALRLAIKKGYLEKTQTAKKANAGLQHLRAVNYSIDDKAGDDDRRGRGGDRYASGPITDFREKEGYKPKISLEYVDDEGRKLCPKEAFRYLSHKFHGKGSGKNKTEKRMKKWQEELLMKQMSSSDTPLQTLERQMDKQKALGSSYLVLSGNHSQERHAAPETRIKK
ncbi:SNU66/SART1 family [Trinorchestia longiramus]|nr:SNU66/SART1 family [Trinorchestia longiramus]